MNNDQIKPKGTADGVPVYCSHDVIVKTADMKPNPKNPNQHPDEQLHPVRSIEVSLSSIDANTSASFCISGSESSAMRLSATRSDA